MDGGEAAASVARRRELGAFLKARRGLVAPEDVGLTGFGPRRVPGLRREEMAELLGISVTWYTWLEQGRDIRASAEVLQSLAAVLALDDVNRRFLYQLADAPLPPRPAPGDLHPLLPWLDVLLPAPAYVVTQSQDLVAWNASFVRLFTDPERLEPSRRNVLWILLMVPELRTRLVDWEVLAVDVIGRFRGAQSLDLKNPRYAEVASDLTGSSELFRRWWERYDVHRFVSRVEVFVLDDGRRLEMQVSQLRAPDRPDELLFAYRPLDAATREGLASLL